MTDDCFDCTTILSDTRGGPICIIKRNRKYIIGFGIGILAAIALIKLTGGKHGKR